MLLGSFLKDDLGSGLKCVGVPGVGFGTESMDKFRVCQSDSPKAWVSIKSLRRRVSYGVNAVWGPLGIYPSVGSPKKGYNSLESGL